MRLADLKPCQVCGAPVGTAPWKFSLEQHIVDVRAVQKHFGLAAMLGGSEALAFAMGTDDPASTVVARSVEILVCTHCACSKSAVEMMDVAIERDPDLAAKSSGRAP